MKIKELVDWSTLSDDQKKPYQEKVYKLLDIIESVDTEGISILTGSNGGGKSMIRQQFSLKYKKDKIRNPNERKCKSISMQLRTSSNPAFGALSSAMMDNEASPTSLNTFDLIQGVFQASGLYKEVKDGEVGALSETGYIILDEPEIGMAEETVVALVLWLFKHIELLKREKIGLMIITHSRLLVDMFLGHSIENNYPLGFYNLDNLSIEEYVDKNRIIIPTDLELLKTNYMFNAINDRMDEKEKQNKGER